MTATIMRKVLAVLLLLTAATTHTDARASCPRIGRIYNATRPNGQNLRLDTRGPIDRYGEISGLAFSPKQRAPSGEPVIYAFSDGGSGQRIGMWDPGNGERLRTLQLSNFTAHNWDWEAMTVGSCGNAGLQDTCLYVADTGDNTARASRGRRTNRAHFPPYILKIREPQLEDYADTDFIPDSHISVLTVDYSHPSSPTAYADVEAVFVDHKGWGEGGAVGDVYFVTKFDRGWQAYYQFTRLLKIPPSAWPPMGQKGHYSPFAVGHYDWDGVPDASGRWTLVTDGQLMGNTWRGGEMSFDGTLIGLATTQNSTLFLRCPGTSVADALAAPNAGSKYCRLWDSPTGFTQVETFAFSPGGGRSLVVPEGHRPRLGWTAFDYSDNEFVCPEPDVLITAAPTVAGTGKPTGLPTRKPTVGPTKVPTLTPTLIPTAKITKGPTQSPTKLPTSPTQSPTKLPTNAPTLEPTGQYPELSMVSNGLGSLGLCEADCDSDAQCQDGLICHVRSEGSREVPGCSGNADLIGDSGEDFCILPALEVTGNNNVTGLSVCQADCDSNDDCQGNLVCYQRARGSNMVPGCRGNPDQLGDGDEDYCILPTASFTELEVVGNGLNGLQVCQADCDKDSDCQGSLLCYQRKLGMDKIPGCSGHADFMGDGTEDFCVHPLSLAAANGNLSSFQTKEKVTSDLAIIIIAFGACVVLLATSVVYMKMKKRRNSKNTTLKDDSSIDMRTAASSLGASKSQAAREEQQKQPKPTGQQEVETFKSGSQYQMAGLIAL
ncbi:unnamed protein product [Cylindrotheca closterium]|uniref:Uncharacterized protein n=1 Tax=Cylindrotheca closterium TaxID=2856 RepID=A0AAD2PUU1_9STRA|nr:unnamed protein product [Cylindrotheca closterium]